MQGTPDALHGVKDYQGGRYGKLKYHAGSGGQYWVE